MMYEGEESRAAQEGWSATESSDAAASVFISVLETRSSFRQELAAHSERLVAAHDHLEQANPGAVTTSDIMR